MGIGVCPYYDCQNRTDMGYCKTTGCINPKYCGLTYNAAEKYIFETTNGARARMAEAAARMRKITRDETDRKRIQSLWVNVKDRLPNDYGAVLITWVNRNPEWYYAHIKDTPFVGVAHFYPKTKRWYWYSAVTEDYLAEYGDSEFDRVDKGIDITHWMQLPEPPKEDEI